MGHVNGGALIVSVWLSIIYLVLSTILPIGLCQMDNFPRRPFLLFVTLFEASMIDKQMENKPIYFEISIGELRLLIFLLW